jgi:hypothetical protein
MACRFVPLPDARTPIITYPRLPAGPAVPASEDLPERTEIVDLPLLTPYGPSLRVS